MTNSITLVVFFTLSLWCDLTHHTEAAMAFCVATAWVAFWNAAPFLMRVCVRLFVKEGSNK